VLVQTIRQAGPAERDDRQRRIRRRHEAARADPEQGLGPRHQRRRVDDRRVTHQHVQLAAR